MDVIIFTECWLNNFTVVPVLLGYNSFRTYKHINKNGGVIAYVRDNLTANVREPSCEDCNCLEITLSSELMLLGIYRSPSFKDINAFLRSLDSILNNATNTKHIILAGDLNLDLCSVPLNVQCADYLCLLTRHKLLPAITNPTRGKACLDHFFLKPVSDSRNCMSHRRNRPLCVCGWH